MAVVEVISVGDFKKLLDKYDDELGLCFDGYQFKELQYDGFNCVDVVLNEVSDHLPPNSSIRNKP